MTALEVGASAVLGALFGSFLGVVVCRVPMGLSIGGRSRCDACDAVLTYRDLVPVISWTVTGGRCRRCGAKVPATWTLLEIACAALAVVSWWRYPDIAVAPLVAASLALLLALSIIDLQVQRLPRQIVLWGVVVAASWIAIARWVGAAFDPIGAAVGALLYWGVLRAVGFIAAAMGRPEGMGGGDIRLAFFIGLVVGALDLPAVGVAFGGAVLLGGLAALAMLLRGAKRSDGLPFGPMMAAGAAVAVLWGSRIADWYLHLVLR